MKELKDLCEYLANSCRSHINNRMTGVKGGCIRPCPFDRDMCIKILAKDWAREIIRMVNDAMSACILTEAEEKILEVAADICKSESRDCPAYFLKHTFHNMEVTSCEENCFKSNAEKLKNKFVPEGYGLDKEE
jgi:hypothetical protein